MRLRVNRIELTSFNIHLCCVATIVIAVLNKLYSDKCDVRYQDQCFFSIFVGGHGSRMNQHSARLACQKYGARPGNIYSEQHMDMIFEYLRPWILTRDDGLTMATIRTGMLYDPKVWRRQSSCYIPGVAKLRVFNDY